MTENLTRVEVICLDKKAGDVLRAVAGLAIEAKATPVANAQVRNGKVEAASNGELVTLFTRYLSKRRIAEVNSDITREFCLSIGQSPDRYTYVLRKALEHGLLKRIGKGKASAYKVQGGK